jgi:DNA topoisomerase-3
MTGTVGGDEGSAGWAHRDARPDHRGASKARIHAAPGKSLEATDKGIRLIEVVHPEVKPAMTGQWKPTSSGSSEGRPNWQPFLKGIERTTSGRRRKGGQWRRRSGGGVEATKEPGAIKESAPTKPSGGTLQEILGSRFRFEAFRPNQEAVCRALTAGEDVLLVMPTGSGKSLCYQLPAVARGGTGLVISPLIALMEDQVIKLAAQGFAAERIHSNRDRAESRAVCRAYLEGKLDFCSSLGTFARGGLSGNARKRTPAVVAIDEAHCIRNGDDFRPDYRTIGQHLPALRRRPSSR